MKNITLVIFVLLISSCVQEKQGNETSSKNELASSAQAALSHSSSEQIYLNYPSSIKGMTKKVVRGNSFFYSPISNFDKNSKRRYVEFRTDIKKSGMYNLRARVMAKNGSENSFFVSINGSSPKPWHIPVGSGAKLKSVESFVALHSGVNKFRFYYRESGTKIADLNLRLLEQKEFRPKPLFLGYPSTIKRMNRSPRFQES